MNVNKHTRQLLLNFLQIIIKFMSVKVTRLGGIHSYSNNNKKKYGVKFFGQFCARKQFLKKKFKSSNHVLLDISTALIDTSGA